MDGSKERLRAAVDAMRANFALEGIQFTAAEIELQERIVRGEISTEEALARIRTAFTAPREQ